MQLKFKKLKSNKKNKVVSPNEQSDEQKHEGKSGSVFLKKADQTEINDRIRAEIICINNFFRALEEEGDQTGTLTYKVEMTCSGCSGAVDRILKKLQGVDSYEISLESKSVVVKTSLPESDVTTAIKKSGKATELVSSE
ncbi:Cytosolic copper metallochaperone [Nowakowskiella sp. JEL0407]|nr:Cytosolic copper metallochaperone [Nowakowskiella sp. JEL0407]